MLQLIKYWQKTDKYLLVPNLFTVVTSLLILTIFAIYYRELPPKLPLFYSLPWGQDQLVNKPSFLLLPALPILNSLINLFIFTQLHPQQIVLRRILLLNIVLINIVVLVTALKIIFIFL